MALMYYIFFSMTFLSLPTCCAARAILQLVAGPTDFMTGFDGTLHMTITPTTEALTCRNLRATQTDRSNLQRQEHQRLQMFTGCCHKCHNNHNSLPLFFRGNSVRNECKKATRPKHFVADSLGIARCAHFTLAQHPKANSWFPLSHTTLPSQSSHFE